MRCRNAGCASGPPPRGLCNPPAACQLATQEWRQSGGNNKTQTRFGSAPATRWHVAEWPRAFMHFRFSEQGICVDQLTFACLISNVELCESAIRLLHQRDSVCRKFLLAHAYYHAPCMTCSAPVFHGRTRMAVIRPEFPMQLLDEQRQNAISISLAVPVADQLRAACTLGTRSGRRDSRDSCMLVNSRDRSGILPVELQYPSHKVAYMHVPSSSPAAW